MNFWLQYSNINNFMEEYINSIFGVPSSLTKIFTITNTYFGIKNNY
jgi:hypothetical protein